MEVAARRVVAFRNESNGLTCPKALNSPIESVGENQDQSNENSASEKENPGALAGATEINQNSFWSWFDNNADQQARASRVVDAVMDCYPEDRVLFLETILDNIRPGWPQAYYADLMEEAGWWANNATRGERKAYMLACYRRLSHADKQAFRTYITGAAA